MYIPAMLSTMTPIPGPASLVACNKYSPSSVCVTPSITRLSLSEEILNRSSVVSVMSTLLFNEMKNQRMFSVLTGGESSDILN